MVGYRNVNIHRADLKDDFIRHSDGGVSERRLKQRKLSSRLYQAFRWWGIGTLAW